MLRLVLSAIVAISFAGSPVLAAIAPANGETTSVSEFGGGKKKGHKKGHKKHKHKHKKGITKKKQAI